MHPALADAITRACSGSWQQQWKCGWHQPTTTAANAGAFAGHNVAPFLILGALILLIALLASKAKSRNTAPTS